MGKNESDKQMILFVYQPISTVCSKKRCINRLIQRYVYYMINTSKVSSINLIIMIKNACSTYLISCSMLHKTLLFPLTSERGIAMLKIHHDHFWKGQLLELQIDNGELYQIQIVKFDADKIYLHVSI